MIVAAIGLAAAIASVLAPLAGRAKEATASAMATAAAAIPGDRWIEIDLYWFDPGDVQGSAERFWDRYAPLYNRVQGYRGVVLNFGVSVDFIMGFTGDLGQPVSLPDVKGQELGVRIAGPLIGDTAKRQRAWAARFALPNNAAARVPYGAWRYEDVRRLADALRSSAWRHGVTQFKVAALAAAFPNTYGEIAAFAKRHPEAWTRWGSGGSGDLDTSAYFDPNATLHADPRPLAALSGGIPDSARVAYVFGAQWGALSRSVGLEGVMLRDGFGLPRDFVREGPNGAALPDAAAAHRLTDGVSAMLHALKHGNPSALTMMWSNAATATSDWRANGLDLERIAREGDLDIFVDQTWAGAWGEVGVRQHTFWNAPILGWTYQLASLLEHSAVVAGTRVHHYPLVETFDAWES